MKLTYSDEEIINIINNYLGKKVKILELETNGMVISIKITTTRIVSLTVRYFVCSDIRIEDFFLNEVKLL